MLWTACSAWLVSYGSNRAAKFRRAAGSLEFAVRRKDARRDYPVMTAHLRHSSCDTLWRGYLQPPRSSAPQVWGRYATWPRAICVNHICHSTAPALPTLCSCRLAENTEQGTYPPAAWKSRKIFVVWRPHKYSITIQNKLLGETLLVKFHSDDVYFSCASSNYSMYVDTDIL